MPTISRLRTLRPASKPAGGDHAEFKECLKRLLGLTVHPGEICSSVGTRADMRLRGSTTVCKSSAASDTERGFREPPKSSNWLRNSLHGRVLEYRVGPHNKVGTWRRTFRMVPVRCVRQRRLFFIFWMFCRPHGGCKKNSARSSSETRRKNKPATTTLGSPPKREFEQAHGPNMVWRHRLVQPWTNCRNAVCKLQPYLRRFKIETQA